MICLCLKHILHSLNGTHEIEANRPPLPTWGAFLRRIARGGHRGSVSEMHYSTRLTATFRCCRCRCKQSKSMRIKRHHWLWMKKWGYEDDETLANLVPLCACEGLFVGSPLVIRSRTMWCLLAKKKGGDSTLTATATSGADKYAQVETYRNTW